MEANTFLAVVFQRDARVPAWRFADRTPAPEGTQDGQREADE